VAAVVVDLVAGEPPPGLHPVVLMGRYLDGAARLDPGTPAGSVAFGAAAWGVGVVAAAVAGRLPHRPATAILLLSTTVSLRMLLAEVDAVEDALARSLDEGRTAVARIVSRPTASLDEAGVREAAISSLVENLSDAVVGSWFWYALCGLPGALAYRFVNTADAVWGYRDHRRFLGMVPARADDLANLVPARLTALALRRRGVPVGLLRRHARVTPSPNGGYPMAAAALSRGIRLTKPGVYVVNPDGRPPGPSDTRALGRRALAVGIGAGLAAAAARGLGAGIPR